MIYRTFSRRSEQPIRERRRRRWSDTVATAAAILGVVLDQAAAQIESFPDRWRPIIRTAAFAFGAIATLERLERRHDYKRFVGKLEGKRDNET